MFWPPFCVRTDGPIHCPPDSWVEVTSTCEYWSLVNVAAFQVAPEDPPLTDPATVCDVIFSPPSLMLVQVPVRFPLARLKLSDAVAADACCVITPASEIISARKTSSRVAQRTRETEWLAATGNIPATDPPPLYPGDHAMRGQYRSKPRVYIRW